MSVDVSSELVICCPAEVVASVIFNPKCDKLWVSGISKSFPLASGMLTKGAKVEWVGEYFGRKFSTFLFVTKYEENKIGEFSLDEPFPMIMKYELSDAENGTLVKIRIKSVGENLIDLPPAILSKKVLAKIQEDLRMLKKHLELEG